MVFFFFFLGRKWVLNETWGRNMGPKIKANGYEVWVFRAQKVESFV